MAKLELGIVTLGLNPKGEYLADFLSDVDSLSKDDWTRGEPLDYQNLKKEDGYIDEFLKFYDALILSPDSAKVGLPGPERFERDPGIEPLYKLIRKAADSNVPLLGINAGHQAINCAYNWAIDKIPDDIKEEYQQEMQEINLNKIIDSKTGEIDPLGAEKEHILMKLSNGFAVLPQERQKWGAEDKVKQIADFKGYPLISRVESEAPVYGVQFNIQPGTVPIFKNFLQLAYKYVQEKQA